ncbi:MAG: hypothetical protein QOH14_1601, partial [Pseudonocardiales bacterium]|nr:hypothetical protein [Pseudonocardiales bacterium]
MSRRAPTLQRSRRSSHRQLRERDVLLPGMHVR